MQGWALTSNSLTWQIEELGIQQAEAAFMRMALDIHGLDIQSSTFPIVVLSKYFDIQLSVINPILQTKKQTAQNQ